jgi:hypothetical protein
MVDEKFKPERHTKQYTAMKVKIGEAINRFQLETGRTVIGFTVEPHPIIGQLEFYPIIKL